MRRPRWLRRRKPEMVFVPAPIRSNVADQAIRNIYGPALLAQINQAGPLLHMLTESVRRAEDAKWEALGLEPIDWHAE